MVQELTDTPKCSTDPVLTFSNIVASVHHLISIVNMALYIIAFYSLLLVKKVTFLWGRVKFVDS